MAIDWTKPIQHHSGAESIVLPERDGEDNVAVAFRVDYSQGWVLWNMSKKCAEQYFRNVPTLTTATEQAHPEIDWAGDVQIWCINDPDDGWTDFTHVWRNDRCVIGWITEDGPENAYSWSLSEFQFRNKPAEPKPVQAILKMFRSPSFGITMRAYLKNEATTMASVRRWHEDTEGELLDVIEVDLHNVEGLEGGK